ncbi:la-related protein 6b [Mugil cephalus]|uniref:la-related protein 6b n=1 Tax=Mugil cephalus TaxID=48193 RepID=UPI001FB6C43B|nr:la-related protein 6b [Mugil cephalus]
MCCRVDAQSFQTEEEDPEGEQLCLKIKALLEDLFSDSHLAEDGFLLKHVQKNKQGYVSLKLLTCLKKVKALTANWYMTLAGAAHSDLLEVNDEFTKVRRVQPLPRWLLCSPTSKLLLVWNFSEERSEDEDAEEHPSLSEKILQKFSVHGAVTSVWVLLPGEELPRELQCYAKRHKELGQHLCAVVKFDSLEAVRKAYNALKAEEEQSDGKAMCVVSLGFQSTRHFPKEESPEEENRDQPGEDTPSQENAPEIINDLVQQKPPSSPVKVPDETPDAYQSQTSLDICTEDSSDQIVPRCKVQSGSNQRYSKMSLCSGDAKEYSCSPWVLRRRFEALNPKGAGHLKALSSTQKVLRQPLGPDGTGGFQRRVKSLQQEEIRLPCIM